MVVARRQKNPSVFTFLAVRMTEGLGIWDTESLYGRFDPISKGVAEGVRAIWEKNMHYVGLWNFYPL